MNDEHTCYRVMTALADMINPNEPITLVLYKRDGSYYIRLQSLGDASEAEVARSPSRIESVRHALMKAILSIQY